MNKLKELDIVELTHDIKKHNLKENERGTIVEVYKEGEAYEVEFVSSDGKTTVLLTLMPNDVRMPVSNRLFNVVSLEKSVRPFGTNITFTVSEKMLNELSNKYRYEIKSNEFSVGTNSNSLAFHYPCL